MIIRAGSAGKKTRNKAVVDSNKNHSQSLGKETSSKNQINLSIKKVEKKVSRPKAIKMSSVSDKAKSDKKTSVKVKETTEKITVKKIHSNLKEMPDVSDSVSRVLNQNLENQPVENKIKRTMNVAIGHLSIPSLEEEPGEEYMSKRQLQYFQNILETWREQLQVERKATVQHMQEDPINFPDLLDRAALEEEHKLELQARERELRLIIKIERALSNIRQGDYGYCEKCGSEIGLMRLQVRPTATLCVDCKAIDEIRERQTGVLE